MDLVDLVDVVTLDPGSPVPPFQQVRDQIADAIETAALAPAVRLPPVRQLASDLGLAVNTVARSYRELELAGLVETRGRHGTFVATGPSPARRPRPVRQRNSPAACGRWGSVRRSPS